MSPKLKPLLLPQLVEERNKTDDHHQLNGEAEFPYTSYTTNSSSSDIVSPVTPTFSTRGHFRGSSSTSSIDVPYTQPQDTSPPPPPQQIVKKQSKRQLPDVEEEPLEREEDKSVMTDQFGLYSCLCDEPCEHRKSTDQTFAGDFVTDGDFDYDIGCLSDGELTSSQLARKQEAGDSQFLGLTSLGSRLTRWKSSRKGSTVWSPSTDTSFDNILSRGPSSRSSSISSPNRQMSNRSHDHLSNVALSMSGYDSVDSLESLCELDDEVEETHRAALERDREKAATPLLPPLMMAQVPTQPAESPLQSPTIALPAAAIESPQAPAPHINYSRPSLSTRPSASSLRHGLPATDLPQPLPAIIQEQDEWSDRLGHANFTIMPQPYEPEVVVSLTINKFREDWEAARVNYTKHLVRTGENYGQTSKIYGLTEAKWAETENRWKTIHESIVKQVAPANHRSRGYTASSRNQSRGRGRGRSGSASAIIRSRTATDDFAGMEWQRIEDSQPSAVPRMLDAEGKFPSRGDEDIVGPMHRAATMERSHSEEKYGAKFWRHLAGRVGLRR